MTRRKKSKKKGNSFTAKELQREVLKLFKRHPKKRMHPKQVAKKIQAANNKDSVLYAMQKLASDNQLKDWGKDTFQLHRWATSANDRKETVEGRVDMTRTGSAYIVVEGQEQDIHVSGKNLNTALNGDTVLVSTWTPRGRNKPEGEVKKVIERAADHFMGTLYRKRKHAFVVPDKMGMNIDIFVEEDDMNGAQEGEKVVVKVVEWGKRSPRGIVTYVLGESGSSDLEMKAILVNNGFYLDFPDMVEAEADDIPTDISLQEIHRRRDMREVTTFTIDPSDAKDFDDALSLRHLDNGHLEIGVHIADVAHYVLPGSALDKEAYKRSTSVYLVDRVLPMLPEKLSNGLCSLRPNEDKCTFSAVFTFDKNYKIIERWFGRTITHSNRRFSYEEAQEVIESGEGDFAKELDILNKLHLKLRKKRFKKGSIDFDTEEVRFKLDEDGTPIDIYVKERKEAHMLIEEFMLLANREVATYIHKKADGHEIPFVYRIHDEPNPEKVEELSQFAKELGYQMHINTPQDIAKSYNRLKEAAKNDKGLALLAPIAIRTMAKAAYSTDNIGHYGLGFQFYSHFTSPIRRYSDVLTHRILANNLEGKTLRVPKEPLEEKCKHISAMERKAMDAERESIKYKQVEFIEKHVGEEFDGRISGMIDRGIFVELVDSKCEGMVGFDSMSESFDVAEGRLHATGKRTGKVLKMGDLVRVKILEADLERRRIEMAMVEE